MLAKKNELKARGTLLMALPDKHQLKFNIHKDAKSLMEAIEKRFKGNKETNKVQKTLLKQQYENFSCTSSESLDQIHDRLQRLISQLEILGETISQEDINLKFLRSLPSKWKIHTLIWRNKADLEEQSLDDLFNNLKIYEAKVKGSSTSSQNTQNIAFVSSNNTDSTNELVSVVPSVSVASSKATVSTLPNVDSLSDAVIYSYFESQSNSPQLDNKDLKQFDPDDLEEMDLKRGHFARECRSPRDNRNKEATRRPVPTEAEEEPTNYALMAYASSSSSSSFGSDNETSSKNLSKLLESQVSDKIGLGFNSQVFNSKVFDCDEVHSHESDNIVPKSPENDRYKTGEGYNVVPSLYTGNFMPPKPDLVFNDAPNASETVANVFNIESSTNKLSKDMSKTHRESVKKVEHPKQAKNIRTNNQKSRACVEQCNEGESSKFSKDESSHSYRNVVPTTVLTRSSLVSFNAARPVPTVVPQSTVKSPRSVKHVVNKAHSPIRRPINHRPTTKNSNFNKKVTTIKVNKANVVQGTKGNVEKSLAIWVWKPKCKVLDHVSRLASASMTLKKFDYTDALGKSKSVMAWVPKRH
nr:hypothetical protein [Tanacetum cinerariifolium]